MRDHALPVAGSTTIQRQHVTRTALISQMNAWPDEPQSSRKGKLKGSTRVLLSCLKRFARMLPQAARSQMLGFGRYLRTYGKRAGIKSVNCSRKGQRRCNFLIGSLTEAICCAVCNELHTAVGLSLFRQRWEWTKTRRVDGNVKFCGER